MTTFGISVDDWDNDNNNITRNRNNNKRCVTFEPFKTQYRYLGNLPRYQHIVLFKANQYYDRNKKPMTCNDISNNSSQTAPPLGIYKNHYNSHNSQKSTNEYMISFLLHSCSLYIPCIFLSVLFSSGWLASSWLLFSTSATIGGSAPLKRDITAVASFWDMIVETQNMAQTTYSLKNMD